MKIQLCVLRQIASEERFAEISAGRASASRVSDERAAAKPAFAELVADARQTGVFGMTGDALGIFIAQQVGDPRPMDIRHQDGRIMRSTCNVLPNGSRMLSYFDVTDLVRRADDARKVALQPSMSVDRRLSMMPC